MMLPRPVEAVVFDMDGVLFDTETLYERAALAAAEEHGIAMTSEFFRSTIGSPWPVIRTRLLEQYGATTPVDALQATSSLLFRELIEARMLLKPGVLELIDFLDELGVPTAIATSSTRPTVERHLETHKLAGRFRCIVAHGDYVRHKPDPDPFLKAAEGLAVDPKHCLALEDSHHGVRSAHAAGMMTIMVPDLLLPTDDIRTLCLHVASDLHEVRRIITSNRRL